MERLKVLHSPYAKYHSKFLRPLFKFSFLPWPDVCDISDIDWLDEWIMDRPLIANAIVWETSNGPRTYSQWTEEQKVYLWFFMYTRLTNESFPIDDPVPNQLADLLEDEDYARTLLSLEHAWWLFLAQIANSLILETVREREISDGDEPSSISWQLTEYSSEELATILDSRSYFKWRDNCVIYHGNEEHVSLCDKKQNLDWNFLTVRSFLYNLSAHRE